MCNPEKPSYEQLEDQLKILCDELEMAKKHIEFEKRLGNFWHDQAINAIKQLRKLEGNNEQ